MGPGRSPKQGVRMIRSKGLELGWSKLGIGLVRQKGQEVLGRGSGGTRWKTIHRLLMKGRRARIWSHLSGQRVMGSRIKSNWWVSSANGTKLCTSLDQFGFFKLARPVACSVCQFFPVTWAFLSAEESKLSADYIYSLNTDIPHTLLHWPVVAIIGFHTDVNITRLITQSVLLGKI